MELPDGVVTFIESAIAHIYSYGPLAEQTVVLGVLSERTMS